MKSIWIPMLSALALACALPQTGAAEGETDAARTPPNAVALASYTDLLALLPGPRSGWDAEVPTGGVEEDKGISVCRAERVYRKDAEASLPSIAIAILDYAAAPERLTALARQWQEDYDPEEGPGRDGSYERPVTIEGFPALEEADPRQQFFQYTILVAGRFKVIAQASDTTQNELQAWLKLVDLKKLAELKK